MDEIQLSARAYPYLPTQGIFEGVSLIIDSTDFAIPRPTFREDRNLYSSGRKKENTLGRYNIKYTIGIQPITGRICYLSNPEPGSTSDITALRNSNLCDSLSPTEILLADKGYQGHPQCLSPFKGHHLSPQEEALNEVIASVRQLVECVIGRIKSFGVLGKKRFQAALNKHPMVCNVCCQIVNITMQRHPVWIQTNRYLLR
jgi:hypothetical protein